MKILGVIPARGGSKGLLGKNKKVMAGKPLISYSIEAAIKSNLDFVAVSSDDDEILAIADSYGVTAIKRPEYLSMDNTPTLPVLQHAVEVMGGAFDAVMTLQPTSPLRTSKHINEAIDLFQSFPDADSLVSIIKVPHKFGQVSLMNRADHWVVPVSDGPLILRRQEKDTSWARNGAAVYITKIQRLAEYIFGGKIVAYEMSKLYSIDIDDLEDFQMAEALVEYMREHNLSY